MGVVLQVAVGLSLLVPMIGPIGAAELTLEIVNDKRLPVADAVVVLAPQKLDGTVVKAPPLPQRQVVGQRKETFIPHVLIAPRGGQVVFTNEDATRHHVYSFSPAKAFELVVAPGGTSDPVSFDRTGVVVVGCNIHDRMLAYIYVTDQPWAALADKNGRASFSDLPEGIYLTRLWHPRLRPGHLELTQVVTLDATDATLEMTLDLLPDQSHRPDRERMKY